MQNHESIHALGGYSGGWIADHPCTYQQRHDRQRGPDMKEQVGHLVKMTNGPLGFAMVIVSLVGLMGWQYTRAQLGGRPPARRAGGFGIGGLALAVLGLALARVTLLN